eukprot:5842442-Alexandrium_andersonii.AAC.1
MREGFAIIVAGVFARVIMALVGTVGLCMCSERLAHVRCGLNCTCRWPSCTRVRRQPLTSSPAPLLDVHNALEVPHGS